MSETIIWKVIEPIISKEGDAFRHEDKYSSGVPDISYGLRGKNGWIESKFLTKWPSEGLVKLRKFTSQQRNWITRRQEAGGNCFIILLVGKDKKYREFFIFSGEWAKKLGHMSEKEMIWHSEWFGNDHDLAINLIDILTN